MLRLRSNADRVANRVIVSSALAQANLIDTWNNLRGSSSPEHRLGDPAWERDATDPMHPKNSVNICIFVIYSSTASYSTVSYLQALKDAGFAILAINNARTSEEFLSDLKRLCWRVYNRQNIGRDIGAFKDGIMRLYSEGYLQQCQFLCLANDSMQFIPGLNGQDFTSQISRFTREDSGALFSHESHQVTKHYQSYFQILDNKIINSDQFYQFWRNYRPLSHREHCIYKGEIKLSKNVYNHIAKAKVLYTPEALLGALRNTEAGQAATVDQILGIMPSIARTKQSKKSIYALDQLSTAALERKPMDAMSEHYLAELIQYSNPSHIAAFLYPAYLKCPLIKHDLCLAGSFSTGKALLLFNDILYQAGIGPDERQARAREFRDLICSKGIPSDYRNKPIQKALKGVTNGFQYTAS